jgi:hypothetical protein
MQPVKSVVERVAPRERSRAMDETPAEERLWRTLVRVCDVDAKTGVFWVIIPAWDAHTKADVGFIEVPFEIRELVQVGKRFHAKVNIGALSSSDLRFEEWENHD